MHRPHQHGHTVAMLVPAWPGDQEGSDILRLEALRSPGEPGYMVAVYRMTNNQTIF